uniref:Baseplate protein n=4 Tax=unclassified bacterial viruses TaxID=12333 RepID=A0AAU6W2M4_9VIRU
MAVDTESYFGQTDPTSAIGEWNQTRFLIRQQMANLNTSMPVEVLSVTGVGVAPVGFVSIRILVDQVTGNELTVPHGEIANVPYVRVQGGTNAVIIDPQVGDIGMAMFCSRDITAVKNARKNAPPGSRRSYDFSDCAYLGGVLNGAPTQYIQFTEGGILLHSPSKVRSEAPLVQIDGDVVQIGNVEAALLRLIDERLIALYNSHTHGNSPVPNVPLTPETVATAITRAN